jgi:tetratricopeptide (TPR) repeat protein
MASLDSGQNEQTFECFTKACALDPGNDEYRQALEEARRHGVDENVARAEAAQKGGDPAGALNFAERALSCDPQESRAAALRSKAKAKIAAAEKMRAEALREAAEGAFADSNRKLQDARKLMKSLPGIEAQKAAVEAFVRALLASPAAAAKAGAFQEIERELGDGDRKVLKLEDLFRKYAEQR